MTTQPQTGRDRTDAEPLRSLSSADNFWTWSWQPGAEVVLDQQRCCNLQIPSGKQASLEWDACPQAVHPLLPAPLSPFVVALVAWTQTPLDQKQKGLQVQEYTAWHQRP